MGVARASTSCRRGRSSCAASSCSAVVCSSVECVHNRRRAGATTGMICGSHPIERNAFLGPYSGPVSLASPAARPADCFAIVDAGTTPVA